MARPTNGTPFSEHPRYSQRRFMILSGAFGMCLSVVVLTTYSDRYLYVLLWLLGSIILCFWDLFDWKLQRAASAEIRCRNLAERRPLLHSSSDGSNDDGGSDGNGDDDDKDRPRIIILILDLLLFLALVIFWLNILADMPGEYYRKYYSYCYHYAQYIIVASYCTVTIALNAIGHILCFWNELMSMKRLDWQRAFGRKRLEWENRLNGIVTAALNASRQDHLNTTGDPRQCTCPCDCHVDNLERWTDQENNIVERILRALGKSPSTHQAVESDNLADEAVASSSASSSKKQEHKCTKDFKADRVVDVEAGSNYQYEAFSALTPSSSGTASEPEHESNTARAADSKADKGKKRLHVERGTENVC